MKKTYISPAVVAVALDASGLMAVSLGVNNDTAVDTSKDGTQLGREDKQTEDIWNKSW